MTDIQQLRANFDKAQHQYNEAIRKQNLEHGLKQVGKCYRVRDNYSMPQTASDYWYLYLKVTGCTENGYLTCTTFRKDSRGSIEFNTGEDYRPYINDSYKEITEKQWRNALEKLKAEVAAL